MENLTIKQIAEPVGGVVALSLALGMSRGAVSQWDVVPLERVLQVEEVTGIPRERLRPDFFRQPADCRCTKISAAKFLGKLASRIEEI